MRDFQSKVQNLKIRLMSAKRLHVLVVLGTRPEAIKLAP